MHRIVTVVLLFALAAFIAAPALMAEDQPHMQAALESLRQAKEHLQQASRDKGGHRDKAMKSVDAAIKHVEEGMKYDNTHESRKEEKKSTATRLTPAASAALIRAAFLLLVRYFTKSFKMGYEDRVGC